ncbi:MAG: hypothetical protein ACK5EU_13925 [Pseudanabaena sp.]|jgi:hypothetical protein|nr:hypothetical protein [Pseudanabaena sp. M109S1SP2A07QC]MCA6572326.1 hypothetical protein [Pseudanabaena sp. M53BS1SP1A06MG]MCA6581374.1 hypothetical protein [Pseudanabaena sp. M34BS1SP1A06MG]MCA6591782.1 hypothetical protein [Pseudanabaena sp. M38BS1SP1A06MG]MCA6599650.1 hypothetical protein [Pseudanabaena sp. M57BS1SP1A06MG]MCA6605482.1 hypothetical protein [Pseudanabaena sp. M007S1SP1A06QC]MCA6611088.1 hypothetical protein [Pseudanabaena sp. M158S2SP1A06QC]MCA6622447.1 hypothetical prot
MSNECAEVHKLTNNLERHYFPFDKSKIPLNGIYVLFEKNEKAHGQDRIVRIGTHTGNNQLFMRLQQHFLNENKDRSIFRKNIGRALLNKQNDPFLEFWDIDLTTRKAKDKYLNLIDFAYQQVIEKQVSEYIRENFSFTVFEVTSKAKRIEVESKLISTLSWCDECKQSDGWLGNSSPKEKIVKSGLWLVNELYKTPFEAKDIESLASLAIC